MHCKLERISVVLFRLKFFGRLERGSLRGILHFVAVNTGKRSHKAVKGNYISTLCPLKSTFIKKQDETQVLGLVQKGPE